MQNVETRHFKVDKDALAMLLEEAKSEERKGRALAISIRLEALATYITNKGLKRYRSGRAVAPRSHPL